MDLTHIPLLTIVTFLPLAGAFLLLFFKRPPDDDEAHGHGEEHNEGAEEATASTSGATTAVRGFAFAVSLVTLLASSLLPFAYHAGRAGFQLQEGPYTWIAQFGVKYH